MKGTFFDRFRVPKLVPKIYLIFPCRVCDTGKPDGAAEKLKVFEKLADTPAVRFSTKPPGEWEECYLLWKMRTALQRETQNRTVLSILQSTARNRDVL